ncbi:MAG: hypothetical protein FWF03_05155, partial [Defluviitaleaceae bacterium]|nr:hypothetical protein [Defluviitaleaceae bacterium]
MKKIIYRAAVVCVAFMLGASCAGSGNKDESTAENIESGQAASQEGADEGGQKTLYGEISEVIGNALIVKEIYLPEFSAPDFDASGFEFPREGMTEITLPDGTKIPIGEDGRPDL